MQILQADAKLVNVFVKILSWCTEWLRNVAVFRDILLILYAVKAISVPYRGLSMTISFYYCDFMNILRFTPP